MSLVRSSLAVLNRQLVHRSQVGLIRLRPIVRHYMGFDEYYDRSSPDAATPYNKNLPPISPYSISPSPKVHNKKAKWVFTVESFVYTKQSEDGTIMSEFNISFYPFYIIVFLCWMVTGHLPFM